ncbi:hypothetical protein JYU04_01590 [Dehalococcoides mccartyi]|nr:hypothetical protein [Dehalococcoides mccartyi]
MTITQKVILTLVIVGFAVSVTLISMLILWPRIIHSPSDQNDYVEFEVTSELGDYVRVNVDNVLLEELLPIEVSKVAWQRSGGNDIQSLPPGATKTYRILIPSDQERDGTKIVVSAWFYNAQPTYYQSAFQQFFQWEDLLLLDDPLSVAIIER